MQRHTRDMTDNNDKHNFDLLNSSAILIGSILMIMSLMSGMVVPTQMAIFGALLILIGISGKRYNNIMNKLSE